MHLRRALLLMAVVLLGVAAVEALVGVPSTRVPREPRTTQVAPPPPVPPTPTASASVTFRYRPGRKPPVRRLRAGTHVTLQVASTRAGEVLLRGLGLVQPVEPGTPASFDVLLTAPGRYDAVLDPVVGRPVRVGHLVVSGCCRRP